MSPAEDMVEALEVYYTTGETPKKYNEVQRRAIVKRFYWVSHDMAIRINDQVREIYAIGEYALPGVSILVKALRDLGDLRTYHVEQKALPMPEFDVRAYLAAHDKAVEEGAEKERDRVRGKRHRTTAEEWWLKCMDYGRWLPMPDNWEAGEAFPPRESLQRVMAGNKVRSSLHHGKRDAIPSEG